VALDALVFTNLSPEHIESHGSLAKYAAAKLSLMKHLEESPKRPRIVVANADDQWGKEFLKARVEVRAPFSLADAAPYSTDERNVRFVWRGGELFTVPLPGLFNLQNVLAALSLCEALGVPRATIKNALEHTPPIAGRAERVEQGQAFAVVVDYAHTPESLQALFETYRGKRLICVMGSTGGGRDKWKRPKMGTVADTYCETVFLTNEDPYDEDPRQIIDDIAKGFSRKKPHIILERRAAIREALREAKSGDVVLITGKGTDPYLMGRGGSKEKWSDKKVVQEELHKLGYN
jgi:UDP-N-acetylmuramoyl-L-alanyl-D-glutamate--2,6-diaminopimelate ligase